MATGLKVVDPTTMKTSSATNLNSLANSSAGDDLDDIQEIPVPPAAINDDKEEILISDDDDIAVIKTTREGERQKRKGGPTDAGSSPAKISKMVDDDSCLGSIKHQLKMKLGPVIPQEIRVSDNLPPTGVPLDSYYYASLDGNPVPQEEKKKYKFKCQACKKMVDDNVKMMKHLHGHIDDLKQFNLDLSDLTQCKYCFREFPSPFAAQSHVEKVHVSDPVAPVCRICSKEFAVKSSLIKHMKATHARSEMPYLCYVCKFRTSYYRDAIEHFHQVHSNTNKLQCHYCLQVYNIRFGSSVQEGNTYGFYRHLYKHQTKSQARPCPKCCLTFISPAELQHHKETDHVSFWKNAGVKAVLPTNSSNAILVSIVGDSSRRTSADADDASSDASVNYLEYNCIECKRSLHKPSHFTQSLFCSLCKFVSNCTRAFADHTITVHSVPPKTPPKPYKNLSAELTCSCGFSSKLGDMMAKHLAKCARWCRIEAEQLSSYPDSCITTDDNIINVDEGDDSQRIDDEQNEGQQHDLASSSSDNDDKHNMLNILGLMRVSSFQRRRSSSSKKSAQSPGEPSGDATVSESAKDEADAGKEATPSSKLSESCEIADVADEERKDNDDESKSTPSDEEKSSKSAVDDEEGTSSAQIDETDEQKDEEKEEETQAASLDDKNSDHSTKNDECSATEKADDDDVDLLKEPDDEKDLLKQDTENLPSPQDEKCDEKRKRRK